MKKPTRDQGKPQKLRRMAEERMQISPPDDSELQTENFPTILQELRIHQVELEVQNEELRRTREELEESRDQYFDLYDQAPVGYLSTDAKGRIIQANLTASKMLGLPRGNLMGQSLYLLVARDHHKPLLDLLKSGAEGRGKQTLAIEMIKNDGSRFHAQVESAPQLDEDGHPLQFRMAIVDVTERKRVEYQLIQSEERYRRLIETMPDAIFTLLPDGTIGSLNPAFEKITGFIRDDWLGRNFWDLLHPDDLDMAKKVIHNALAGKGGIAEEARILSSTGDYLFVYFIVEPEFAFGKVTGVWAVGRDITRRKKMQEELQKVHDKLEKQVEERTADLGKAISEIKAMKDRLEAENIYFRNESKTKHRYENIIGKSDGLKYVLYRVQQVAPINTTVLILGETGTGKELIAKAIHNMGPRKDRPLITVNCAALPANLIESELFGREKGAFTGADARQVGRFEVAHGSTLCLDEVGELPLEIQAKLLRVVQHNEFERLGSSQTIKVDVRIVATTNRNLEEEARKGRFRLDLYYRLNVFPITVPPLRQRKADIALMVQAFVDRYAAKYRKQITSIPKATLKALQDYPWPGNVRELESILERSVILCPGKVFQLADTLSTSPLPSIMRTLEETERNQIHKILSETRWRIEGKDGAAAILGLHPSTLRARLHKLGIVRPGTGKSD